MPLYRGFGEILPPVNSIIVTRKDRKPRNLTLSIHQESDNYFEKKFGYKFRSQSVFCSGNINAAKKYGTVAVIEPIGKFQVCWSPDCYDFIEIEDCHWLSIEEFILEKNYQIGNLNNALESGNEIMLYCDSYTVVSHEE